MLPSVSEALHDVLDELGDLRDVFLMIAWSPVSFQVDTLARVAALDTISAARCLSSWLDRGIVREARTGPGRFRVPHPVRLAAQAMGSTAGALAVGPLVAELTSRSREQLWGPQGEVALKSIRAVGKHGDKLLRVLADEAPSIFVQICIDLVAEPFANVLPTDLTSLLQEVEIGPEHELQAACAVALVDVLQGRGDTELLAHLAARADDANDDHTLLLVSAQLELLGAEREVDVAEHLRLGAVVNRMTDSRYAAYGRVRLASAELARGRPAQARELLQAANSAIDQHQIIMLEGYAQNRLAQCWFLEGHNEEARRLFELALRRHRDLGQIEDCVHDGIALAGTLAELDAVDEALYAIEKTFELARTLRAERLRLGAILLRGMIRQRAGQLARAEQDFHAAIGMAQRLQERRTQTTASLHLCELQIARGDWSGAWRRMEGMVDLVHRLQSEYLEGYVMLVAIPTALVIGHDTTTWRQRLHELVAKHHFDYFPVDALDALCECYVTGDRARLDAELAGFGDSTEELTVRTMCEHAWKTREDATATPTLVVHREGLWFQGSDGGVDLRRRRAPRMLLKALADAHDAGGRVLSMDELFDTAWPDDAATPESAAQRVYTAIWTLRKMGLDELLERRSEGYLIRAAVRLVWVDDVPG